MRTQAIHFEQLIGRGCGPDVHKDTVVATIRGTGYSKSAAPTPVLLPIGKRLAAG